MAYLLLNSSSGGQHYFPIRNATFADDGYLAFFEAQSQNGVIVDNGSEYKVLVLRRTDMSLDDWIGMISRTASVGAAGWVFGIAGLMFGSVFGAASFFRNRPAVDGYYLFNDKQNDACILEGKIHKTSEIYYP